MGQMINAYSILVGEPEGKRPLGRRSLRGKDNIIVVLREMGSRMWAELIRLGTGTSGVLL